MTKPTDSGFALLTTIWLLVLGSAIAVAVMLTARSASDTVRRAADKNRGAAALASARDQVIADLIRYGRNSRWAGGTRSDSLSDDGVSATMQVSEEGGRLDVLSARKATLDSLFAALAVSSTARTTAQASLEALRTTAQSGKRPLQSLMQLRALNGWTPEISDCLLPLVTIHSGMTGPSPSAAPPQLAQLLALQSGEDDGGATSSQSVAGELYRIEASATVHQSTSRMAWIVRITGNLQQPWWVIGTFPGGLSSPPAGTCFTAAPRP